MEVIQRIQIFRFDPFLYTKDEYINMVNELDDNLPIEFCVLFSSGFQPLTGRKWTKTKIIEFINNYVNLFNKDLH